MYEDGVFPPVLENQDQCVLKIDLRRADPLNPDGGANPDLSGIGGTPNPAVATALIDICSALGFDPSVSYVAIESLRDVESNTAVVSLTEMLGFTGEGTPEPEPEPEPAPE